MAAETGKFSMYGKITTHPGKRDEMAAILLEAAEAMKDLAGCELYIVNVSDDEPDAVWVTELWSSAEAHAASLQMEGTAEMIGRARPLIAKIEPTRLRPIGGKGL